MLNAKAALENTKSQLRQSQRQVSTLTRQVEDMKEVRERLRLENEGLNNVVARKERLLQEVRRLTQRTLTLVTHFTSQTLVRARKAEADAAEFKSQLKSETTTSKKSLREMETALIESKAKSERHEREYNTLRDSFKGLTESFKADHAGLRDELRKREEKMRKEAEAMHKKYIQLVEQVKKDRQANGQGVEEIKRLREESDRLRKEAEERMSAEVARLREGVDRSNRESEGAIQTAKYVVFFALSNTQLTVSQKSRRGISTPSETYAREWLGVITSARPLRASLLITSILPVAHDGLTLVFCSVPGRNTPFFYTTPHSFFCLFAASYQRSSYPPPLHSTPLSPRPYDCRLYAPACPFFPHSVTAPAASPHPHKPILTITYITSPTNACTHALFSLSYHVIYITRRRRQCCRVVRAITCSFLPFPFPRFEL